MPLVCQNGTVVPLFLLITKAVMVVSLCEVRIPQTINVMYICL